VTYERSQMLNNKIISETVAAIITGVISNHALVVLFSSPAAESPLSSSIEHLRKNHVTSSPSQCTITYTVTVSVNLPVRYDSLAEVYAAALTSLENSISTGHFTAVMKEKAIGFPGGTLTTAMGGPLTSSLSNNPPAY
jgi:hypothetical protein